MADSLLMLFSLVLFFRSDRESFSPHPPAERKKRKDRETTGRVPTSKGPDIPESTTKRAASALRGKAKSLRQKTRRKKDRT